jgi:Asp-tRNA(Asn)/Glu-tRNA(Gln) amidotransferase A subunit family amidase
MTARPEPTPPGRSPALDRRRFLAWTSSLGLGATALPALLWAQVEEGAEVTVGMLAQAERLAGLEFTPAERELMVGGLAEQLDAYRRLREVEIPNDVFPALHFDPRPPGRRRTPAGAAEAAGTPVVVEPAAPAGGPQGPFRDAAAAEELAFATVGELAWRLRNREVTSETLTRMYLDRLRRYGPHLEAVVTLTEERALAAAYRADRELDAGTWRGPLHGVPWGAKDLLAVRGYPTTWGATPYRDQVLDLDATAVRRLDEAGAVLVAKLTLGALAWGDVWFGGRTRNPWDLEQGSSGSSAGSAAATAAGLVGFAVGTETWGSIVSPATRVGASGLRPTFGRVSRHGAMALCWSMDKIGPICRSAEDCALVFAALHGPDGEDPTAVEAPFPWPPGDPAVLRVGYVRALFEEPIEDDPEGGEEAAAFAERQHFQRGLDLATLDALRSLGVELVPMELPAELPVGALSIILSAEAAAAFDELTRSGRDDLLVRQIENAWPNVFRQARTIPAVEYIQANRVRTLVMRAMERALEPFDAYVVPSFGGENLLLTNLTGHPAVVVPNGFHPDGTPGSITFQGRLYGETAPLALAVAYQRATDHHRRHPDLEAEIREAAAKRAAEKAGEGG